MEEASGGPSKISAALVIVPVHQDLLGLAAGSRTQWIGP